MYNSRASYLPRLTVVDLENLPLKHQARKFPPKTNNSQKQSYRYRALLREHTSTDASFSEQNPIAGTTKNPLIYLLTMVGPNCSCAWGCLQHRTVAGLKWRSCRSGSCHCLLPFSLLASCWHQQARTALSGAADSAVGAVLQ